MKTPQDRVQNGKGKPGAASASLELTEQQRYYLTECVLKSEINDVEMWLQCAERNDTRTDYIWHIKHRLDAVRKLKDFLNGCGDEEKGKPLPEKPAVKTNKELIEEHEAYRKKLVNASLWARAWKAAAKKFRALTFKFWVARRLARAWKERAKHYKTESQARRESVRWYINHWRKACAELEAHGLLQGFLDSLNNDEGGKE